MKVRFVKKNLGFGITDMEVRELEKTCVFLFPFAVIGYLMADNVLSTLLQSLDFLGENGRTAILWIHEMAPYMMGFLVFLYIVLRIVNSISIEKKSELPSIGSKKEAS